MSAPEEIALSERLSDGFHQDDTASSEALSSPSQPNDEVLNDHSQHSSSSSSISCIQNWVYLASRLRSTWQNRHSSSSLEFHVLFALFTISVFAPMYHFHAFASNTKFGEPQSMTCRDMFWQIDPSQCGVNGISCQPYSTGWFAIRCPPRCHWPDASLRIWGGSGSGLPPYSPASSPSPPSPSSDPSPPSDLYRGDSRVCVAATHAGVVSPDNGGCALMRLAGPSIGFSSSRNNDITSRPFDSWFPQTMQFKSISSSECASCTNLGWVILCVGISWMAFLLFVVRPNRPWLLGWVITWGFWYCVFVMTVSDAKAQFVAATATAFLMFGAGLWMYWIASFETLWPSSSDEVNADFEEQQVLTAVTLRHQHRSHDDESGYTYSSNETEHPHQPLPLSSPVIISSSSSSAIASPSSSMPLVSPVRTQSRSSSSSSSCGHCLSEKLESLDAVVWGPALNFFFFVIPFLVLLHLNLFAYWTADLNLNSQFFAVARKSSSAMATAAFIILSLVLFLSLTLRRLWSQGKSVWFRYLSSYAVVIGLFGLLAWIFAPDYSLHIHHAFFPLALWPLTRARRDLTALFAQGVLAGIAVNGLVLWPWSPNFEAAYVPSPSSTLVPNPPLLRPQTVPIIISNNSSPTINQTNFVLTNVTICPLGLVNSKFSSLSPLSSQGLFPIISFQSPSILNFISARSSSLHHSSSASARSASFSSHYWPRRLSLGSMQSTNKAVQQLYVAPSSSNVQLDQANAVTVQVGWPELPAEDAAAGAIGYSLSLNTVELYRGTGQALNLTVSKLWPNTTLYFELAYVLAWGTVGTPSDVLIVNTNQAVWLNGSFV